MDNNFTITVATIAAIASAFSALFTLIGVIFSNYLNYKSKKLEIHNNNKMKLISEFADAYSRLSYKPNEELATKAQISTVILISVSNNTQLRNILVSLSNLISEKFCKTLETDRLFIEAMKLLPKKK